MKKRALLFGLIALSCGVLSMDIQAAIWQITYPRTISENDTSADYPLKVLSLALEQTGVKYNIEPSGKYYSQGKSLSRLKDNREINVVWSITDRQREKDLLPIRIPLYKGLFGYRIFLIREDMSERFKYIQNKSHLLKLSVIQGNDWPDTKILQENGFDVITHYNHVELFKMLSTAQGDFFPRSILEIWSELDTYKFPHKFMVQPTLGMYYPSAMYFFVNKKNKPLAHLIKTGLEKAIVSGDFEGLFKETYQHVIEKVDIKNRNIYQLESDFLPPETPLDRKELWFQGD